MKKTIYGSLITGLVLVSVIAFAACSSRDERVSTKSNSTENNSMEMNKDMDHKDGEMNHGNSTEKKIESSDFSAQRNDQTSALIDAYEQTKTALEANDKTKTAEGAKEMLAAFEKFDAKTLPESKRKEYSEIYESGKEHAEHIIKSELDHQKEHFQSLTTDMKDLLALFNNNIKEN